nr:mannose/fructose/sorbose PTS transporter subunit IID [uncultured Clostridium sp.]
MNNKSYKKLTKSDLTQMFIRSNFLQGSWNFEKLQALGYCHAIIPAIKRFYTGEERKKALKRHLEFFNTQPFMTGPILGVTASLEEQKANGIQISDNTIRDVKINLMKSLSDVGDKIFWGTLRPVITAISATFAVAGNILGPIIFFITLNIIRIWIKWWGIGYGYKKGIQIIDEISNIRLQNLIKSFSILGLFVMGVLINRRVNINIPIAASMIDTLTSLSTLQTILNRLLSGLLSLLCTFICIKLLKKKVSAIWIIFGIFILGIIGYGLGLLA